MNDDETTDPSALADAEAALASLVQRLGPDHPDTRAAAERVATLLAAGSPPASDSVDEARPMVGPFVSHALCAAGGVPVGYERLRRLAVRVLYRSALPADLAEMLLAADLASEDPGAITVSPRRVPPPRDTPPAARAQWSEVVEGVAERLDELLAAIARDVQAFPLTGGRVVVPDGQLAALPPPDEADAHALVDELMAELVAAKRSGDTAALVADLALWGHATLVAFARAARGAPGASDALAVGIARGLLGLVPAEREALLAGWSEELDEVTVARLRANT